MKKSFEMNRPEIVLEELDLENVNDVETEGDECLYIQIPLKRTVSNSKKYDCVLKRFCNKYVQDNGNDDIAEKPTSLNLVVDNSDNDKSYFINTFIKINYWGGNDEVCMSKQIRPSSIEQARVDLTLLKFTNPQEYIRQYTRQQFANRPEIKNRLGFVIDEIDEQRLYKSVWISSDYNLCLIGCVPEVDNPESQMQIRRYNQDKIGA